MVDKDNLYDLNMLFEQVGNDYTVLQRFIDIFRVTVPEDMAILKTAIEEGDMDKTRSAAHKMKSSYMLMGADWARDLCFEMETIARNREETEKLPEIFRELSQKFSIMQEKLNNLTF